jgi:hypothetical protein
MHNAAIVATATTNAITSFLVPLARACNTPAPNVVAGGRLGSSSRATLGFARRVRACSMLEPKVAGAATGCSAAMRAGATGAGISITGAIGFASTGGATGAAIAITGAIGFASTGGATGAITGAIGFASTCGATGAGTAITGAIGFASTRGGGASVPRGARTGALAAGAVGRTTAGIAIFALTGRGELGRSDGDGDGFDVESGHVNVGAGFGSTAFALRWSTLGIGRGCGGRSIVSSMRFTLLVDSSDVSIAPERSDVAANVKQEMRGRAGSTCCDE